MCLGYEIVVQFQVDICILNTILMLANFGAGIRSRLRGVGNCWGVCPDCYNSSDKKYHSQRQVLEREIEEILARNTIIRQISTIKS